MQWIGWILNLKHTWLLIENSPKQLITCFNANSAKSLIWPCDCPKSSFSSTFAHSVLPPVCPTIAGAFGSWRTTCRFPFISGSWAKIYPASARHKNLNLKKIINSNQQNVKQKKTYCNVGGDCLTIPIAPNIPRPHFETSFSSEIFDKICENLHSIAPAHASSVLQNFKARVKISPQIKGTLHSMLSLQNSFVKPNNHKRKTFST